MKFNYDQVVDWAIDRLANGQQNDSLLMLASFTKPVDTQEIKPYLKEALRSLDIVEADKDQAVLGFIQFYVKRILQKKSIRDNLKVLFHLHLEHGPDDNDHTFGLLPFYLLYHAWGDLEEVGENHYYKGAHLNNIQDKVVYEAQRWLDIFPAPTH